MSHHPAVARFARYLPDHLVADRPAVDRPVADLAHQPDFLRIRLVGPARRPVRIRPVRTHLTAVAAPAIASRYQGYAAHPHALDLPWPPVLTFQRRPDSHPPWQRRSPRYTVNSDL